MTKPKLSVIDLFAGCGGFALGLEKAGFSTVFVNELNPDALQTYTMNRRKGMPHLAEREFHSNDVKQMVTDKRYLPALSVRLKDTFGIDEGELDLVVGGPPCQGFSGIGHRRAYAVDKEQLPSNHLFQDMAHVIHHLRPRAFIFENVRGLLNARWNSAGMKGEIFTDVLSAFRRIPGYRIGWRLVFAKDYGVPQNRPRVFVIGMREDVKVPNEDDSSDDAIARGFLPEPSGKKPPSITDILGDLEDRDYIDIPRLDATLRYPETEFPLSAIQKELRRSQDGKRIAPMGHPLTEHKYSRHSDDVVAKFIAMQAATNGEIPEKFRTKKFAQRVLPKEWGPGGPTITVTSLPDDYVHYEQPRSLTVREWARLQTFPDWYQFAGKRTTGGIRRAGNPRNGIYERELPKYTQIGNAVPVQLAFEVGSHLAKLLRGCS